MLLIFVNLICWIPAVLGYGIVLVLPRKRLSQDPDPTVNIVVEPLFGLVVLSVIVNVINFSIPIDNRVAALLMIGGWVLFAMRLRILSRNPFTWRSLSLLFLWLLFLSFWATQAPHNFDSGLYHMQSIHWFTKSALPFGLANVHGRLGFNSSWFSAAAFIQLPVKIAEGVNCLSMSALLIYFFGIAVFQEWRKKRNDSRTIFFVLSSLVFVGAIARGNISSPSPDLAVLFLCVLMTHLAMEALETRADLSYRLFQMFVLSLFAATIKPSSLPLLLVPLSLMMFCSRRKEKLQWKPLIGYASMFGGILFITWFLRGIALSGCLNFPIANTCIDKMLWTVPRSVTEAYWAAGKTSARLTYPLMLPILEWFPPWFEKMIRSVDFLVPVVLIIAAIFLHFNRRERFSFQLRWIALPHLIAIASWFFTAPDIRFAAGYFWSLAILLFSAVRPKSTTLKQKMIVATVLCLVVWIPLRRLSYFGYPPVLQAARNPERFLLNLPIPEPQTTPYFTLEGVRIFEADQSTGQCWLEDIPCAPYFNEDLRTIQTSNGDFKMFYYSKAAAP